MRYIKALVILVLFFVGTVFFIQNADILTKETDLTLRLYFIPEMKSLKLPFYYLMLGSFFAGGLLLFALLWWGNAKRMAKLAAANAKIFALESQVCSLKKQLGQDTGKRWWIFGTKKSKPQAIAEAEAKTTEAEKSQA